MSGNGIRCLAQAAAARTGMTSGTLRIATDAGRANGRDPPGERAPYDPRQRRHGRDHHDRRAGHWAELGCDPMRPVAHLGVGNPHSVVGVEDVLAVDLARPRRHGARCQPRDRPARARTERHHDAGPRTGRRHHRGVRHRCLRGRVGGGAWGLVPASTPEIVVHMDGGDAQVRLHDRCPAMSRCRPGDVHRDDHGVERYRYDEQRT